MTDNDVNVRYKATADFSALYREALKAKAALAAMNAEQAKGDRSGVASAAASASARRKAAEAATGEAAAVGGATRAKKIEQAATTSLTGAITKQTGARHLANKAARDAAAASGAVTASHRAESAVVKDLTNATDRHRVSVARSGQALSVWGRLASSARAEASRLGVEFSNTGSRAERMGRTAESAARSLLKIKSSEGVVSGALSRIGQGFSKLMVLLVPTHIVGAIASLVAMVNPLVAGIGALGAAALGTSSSLGTLAGAAVGLVPALSAALGVAAALKTALSGVGGAIKSGIAATNAVSGGGGSSSSAASPKQSPYALSAQEKITRAQQDYARALVNVRFAEQNLFDARKNYRRQVQDLTEAIEQYTDATKASDAASVESAQQNYDNVLASSASTKADKDAALAAIQQAKEQQENDATQNTRNKEDLSELKKGGENNNQSVVDAKRGVTDSHRAVRDAQIALKNEKYNAKHPVKAADPGAAAAKNATDQFAESMAKLSPAAQEFVRWFLKFRDAWVVVQKAVQQAFFSKFVGDLTRINGLLPSIQKMLVPIAASLGTIVDNLIKQLTSSSWKKDIESFGTDVAPILSDVGGILQSLLDAFKDLTMAGLPFLQQVVHWLGEGAKHFATFIENGRKTGSIQGYLENVFNVMKKWWDIIKNVSATLYNYGKAAGPFGQWLTDGLVKMTKGWRDASEQATKKNSPFQQYLNNIKPVLTNMKGLIGDFFKWFGKVSADPKTIGALNSGITFIRTQLGPAIGGLLDTMTKSGLGLAFGKALVAIANAIDTLMKHGGIKGLKSLYGIISSLADGINNFLQTGFGKWLANNLVPPLVVLAGLSFAFGPLFALFGWLAKLAGMKGVLGLLVGLGKGVRGAGRTAEAAADAGVLAEDAAKGAKAAQVAKSATAAEKVGKGAGGLIKLLGGGIGALLLGVATHGKGAAQGAQLGGEIAAEAAAAGKSGGVLGGIFSALGLAGKGSKAGKVSPGQLAEEAIGKEDAGKFAHLKDFKSTEGLAGKAFLAFSAMDMLKQGGEALHGENGDNKPTEYMQESNNLYAEAMKEKDPRKRDELLKKSGEAQNSGQWGSFANGAWSGVVNGLTVGGETAGPVGMIPGAVLGGLYGASSALLRDSGGVGTAVSTYGKQHSGKAFDKYADDMIAKGGVDNVGAGIKAKIQEGIAGAGKSVNDFFNGKDSVGKDGKAKAGGFGGKGTGLADMGTNLGKNWQKILDSFSHLGKDIGKGWDGVVKWFKDTGKHIGDWWNTSVVKPFKDHAKQIGDWWNHNVVMPWAAVGRLIGRMWNQIVVPFFQKIGKAIGDWWNNDVVGNFIQIGKAIGDWWNQDVVGTFQDIGKALGDGWHRNVVVPFQRISKAIGDLWHQFVVVPFQRISKAVGDAWHTFVVVPFQRISKAVGDAWHTYVALPFQRISKVVGDAWHTYVALPFQRISKAVGDGWHTFVTVPFQRVSGVVQHAWDTTVKRFQGVADALGTAWNTHVVNPLKAFTGGIASFVKKVQHVDFAQLFTDTVDSWFNPDKGKKNKNGSGGGGNIDPVQPGKGGDNPGGARWSGTISAMLKKAGAPQSWLGDIETIIQHESSGNASAINNWDINARNGNPSVGLMQVTQSNFREYTGGKTDYYSGADNILAGIKYIQSRYGNPENTPGIKAMRAGHAYSYYAAGGSIPGSGNSDSVPVMAMPGEFVLKKKIASKIGEANLHNLNNGVMSYAEMMANFLSSPRGMSMPGMPRVVSAPRPSSGVSFGDINIYNPKAEAASDSLPRTVRKLSYLHKGK